MLPSRAASHQGFATETLETFLSYASSRLNLRSGDFFVKIGKGNERSIALFERLGFRKKGDVNYFGEIEFRRDGHEPWGWIERGVILVDEEEQ